ncbi:MAG: hypothetical protein KDI79_29120 [Anaerolineae bacterium]|nr:hypothetical protein [Anaerolineae bacterium]
MNISSVSAAGYGGGQMATSLAASASQVKNLQVQDEIAVSVIRQVQDQQKQMAESLVKMMDQSTVDVYA